MERAVRRQSGSRQRGPRNRMRDRNGLPYPNEYSIGKWALTGFFDFWEIGFLEFQGKEFPDLEILKIFDFLDSAKNG